MAYQINELFTVAEVDTLLNYVATDDDRTDHRPDVRSKHPRWNKDPWPQYIVQSALDRVLPQGYVIEEITFQDTKIALKPHTDNGSVPGSTGKTIMLTLQADPVGRTVYFKNHWTEWEKYGAFFTKTKWTPYQYKIPGKNGQLIKVEDIRELLKQCLDSPDTVTDFEVTSKFIDELEATIHKRSLPKLDSDSQNMRTGYIQPGPRRNNYETLTHYNPELKFDAELYQKYLSDIAIEDLHGLTVEDVITWTPGGAIVFDREQLHCSSSCHTRKTFCSIFYHVPGE